MSKQEAVYTLMVISHTNSPTISWQLPLRRVKFIGFSLAALACICLILTFNYCQARRAARELQNLTFEFQEQQQQLLAIAKQAADLEQEIIAVRELDETVRDIMNLAPRATSSSLEIQPQIALASVARLPGVSRGGLSTTIIRTEQGLQTVRELLPTSKNTLETLTKDIAKQQAKERATPSIWPTYGRITSSYGYRLSPFGYGRQFHAGIDIGAPRGTPIYATADGTVSFAGFQSGYGYVVYINHGYGYTTVYAHMSKLGSRSGQQVKRGDVIGYVGSSGLSTGPHLHYEVRVNGKTVNPLPYIGR
ncbi:MAG: M23 family metallopeptidase [Firmicutes bacterium]|nr:M23 family metallopeptidase [Bacillota bacterium]